MRKPIALFLALLLILNLFGFYLAFFVQQHDWHLQAESLIEKNDKNKQVVLSFTRQEFEHINWTRQGKEFNLNGNLYDVVAIHNGGGEIKVIAVADSCEADLFDSFASLVSRQNDSENQNGPLKTLLQHILPEYTLFHINLILFPGSMETGLIFWQKDDKSSCLSDRLSPPPQLG